MLIYLDAKDLINIFEKSNPCSADQFDTMLREGDHKLVYSLLNIIEIAEPLLHNNMKTNVMALLNRVEETPHVYIHTSRIPLLELESAIRAYFNGEEYSNINPYVQRFDYTVDLDAQPTTKDYLNYSIAEIIWDLYSFKVLGGLDSYAKKLKTIFAKDRMLSHKPSIENHFSTCLERTFKLYDVASPSDDIKSFANWIYSDHTRCPSLRLGYEVFHKMIKNMGDETTPSDMEDLSHIDCLPYVDFLTLDKRMCSYVIQACKTMQSNHVGKLCNNSKEIVDKLLLINKK